MSIVFKIINLLMIIVFPLLFLGIINKTKAFWGGRKGASIFQPYYDIFRLLKKDLNITSASSFITSVFSSVVTASTLLSALFVPLCFHDSVIDIKYAFVIFAYTLAVGKFFSIIGAMDAGSSFEGMGASREASFFLLVEPAFFVIMGSFAVITSHTGFTSLYILSENTGAIGYIIIILAVISFFMMILTEGCRVPVDDPNTHLELTMIHEVMILDNSGIDLAMLTYSSALKMFIFTSLICALIIPTGFEPLYSLLSYFLIFIMAAISVGTLESAMARLRMSRIVDFVFFMSSMGLIMLALVLVNIFS